MQVTVRKATTGDIPAMAALRLSWSVPGGDHAGPEAAVLTDLFSTWFADHMSTHLPFVAETERDLVGMAWLLVAERVPSPDRRYRRFGDVQSVYVVPEFRDRGIGAAILKAVLAEARGLGLEHVTVHSNDRAVPLYEGVGFGHDRHWLRWEPE